MLFWSTLATPPVTVRNEALSAEPEMLLPLVDPCAMLPEVSLGGGTLVPLAGVACVPAVGAAPETDDGCVMPVSFSAVLVFLLLELQPKMSAAASANGNVTFILVPPQGVGRRRRWRGAAKRREVPGCLVR